VYVKKKSAKFDAVEMRKAGYSYNLIAEKVDVSKSTLSIWLAQIPYTPNEEVIKRVGKARSAASETKHKQKLASYKLAKDLAINDVGKYTKRDLFILGLALYIGEGEKNDNVGIINADPRIIKKTIVWLQKFYNVPKENFTLAIHLYPDNNRRTSLEYWSKQTGIPLKQFGKTQVDRRQNKSLGKRSKLPHGTAHLRVRAFGNKQLGVLLARRIKAATDIVLAES
jgi:hypothetical protein